jgi:hypothetical protein
MGRLISPNRFGKAQLIGAGLLLCLLAQCLWLLSRASASLPVDSDELFRVEEGLAQWRRQGVAGLPSDARQEMGSAAPVDLAENDGYDPNHSPLWYLMSAVLLQHWRFGAQAPPRGWAWLIRLPNLVLGLLLGASLWYVARRLYGNAGGYIALTLYAFSPGIIRACTLWATPPETAAAWGAFGAVFTAIAVAHTLYAPREVILWNWRRILLLALSFLLAVGSQFSLLLLVPVSLFLMLYVAPTRRAAAFVIWITATVVAFAGLYACYAFSSPALWQGLRHGHFLALLWPAYRMSGAYRQTWSHLKSSCPVLIALFPVAIATYAKWPRTRYFGNTAPLLISLLLLALAIGAPHYPGEGFTLVALPFLMVFVAGIMADLLETRYREIVAACIWGLLASAALWNLLQLARVGTS